MVSRLIQTHLKVNKQAASSSSSSEKPMPWTWPMPSQLWQPTCPKVDIIRTIETHQLEHLETAK